MMKANGDETACLDQQQCCLRKVMFTEYIEK